ncbi:MAG: 4'-phosphopantetheinyl transferase superfamily protein [Burkholderiaceae bacterium]|nr:4'-phosphopantetheinyl transferase superfamily protein [Burkholderiaceae bacterium]
MTENTKLTSEIMAMLGAKFMVSTATSGICTSELFPEEQRYVAQAVEKRQAEFGTARVCARRALAKFGVPPCSLEPNKDRSPRWPTGFKGSITHANNFCAVAVTNSMDISGLGIDIEPATPLQKDLEQLICTPPELAWLSKFRSKRREILGKVFFCAKEAFYKCQYESTQVMLDFDDVEIGINYDYGYFKVKKINRIGGQWQHLYNGIGLFRRVDGLIISAVILPTDPIKLPSQLGWAIAG